jgi:hypothetical protein
MLDERMRGFISATLNIEGAAPYPSAIKDSLRGNSAIRAQIEAGLQDLLKTRELTTLDWIKMTYVDFASEDDLYSYLQKLYDYLFRGSEELPEIPED